MSSGRKFTIGDLAKQSGVGVETVRFYERKGIIRKPSKGTGYRQYAPDDSRRIEFVKRAQELGFTLKEIKELLELNVSPRGTCGDLKTTADAKLVEVEAKIRDLKRIRASLRKLSATVEARDLSATCCRVLDCFESGTTKPIRQSADAGRVK
ncbi:MAG: MerR family DNA-binding protein [Pseudomonadota bacterium]